ncbi:MAG: hypothetical protein ACOZBL_02710 [Patescibacteria group bacterium]
MTVFFLPLKPLQTSAPTFVIDTKVGKKSRQMQTRKVMGIEDFVCAISAPSLKGSPSHLADCRNL